ncbi:MAG: LeuD/DmdB family oxidoreductase small subunit [Nitrososphaerales archaeon]
MSQTMAAGVSGTVTVKFGDDINTDYIIPAYLLQEAWDKHFFADYAFEKYSPTFIKTCRANSDNIVVAGKNFGCGSSREQAVYAIQYNNVNAVIAESFPDIFFRNSINNTFCVVRVESTEGLKLGDRVEIDLKNLIVKNISNDGSIGERAILMSSEERDLLVSGGRLGAVKDRLRQRLLSPP